MTRTLFLDTTVFFDSIDDDRMKTVIDHSRNTGFTLITSITVIGEALVQMRENTDKNRYIISFLSLLDDWDVNILYPSDPVRVLCYVMGDEEVDTRIIREITDRTHLAYAMAYHSDFFITSDKNLKSYRVPKKLEESGFNKPVTLSMQEFKEAELSKK
ncbi:MAG: PIN domain-containing protein [Methanospirillum sp.]|nr:PIN domain-containing protein [Methanospirillum sp.]